MQRYQVFSKWFAGEIMKKCRALKFVFSFVHKIKGNPNCKASSIFDY